MNSLARPSKPAKPSWLTRLGLNEIVVTVWTCLSFYVMYAMSGKNEFLLFFPLAGGTAVIVAMTLRKPVIARVDPLLTLGVFLLNFSILASYLFNSQRFDAVYILGNLASVTLLFTALYSITMKMELDFRKTLVYQCILISVLLPVIIATSHDQWGRMMPAELQANYVSMMAMLAFIGACSVRSLLGAMLLSALPLFTVVAMESRDSLLASGIAALIIVWYRLKAVGWRRFRPFMPAILLGVPIITIGLYFVGIDLFSKAYGVVDSLFLLSDEHRGLGSGGSGRTELWNAAINLWITHPIFGVGFKGHPLLMPEQMYAHSAYLGMLADVGIVGFASYMLIVGMAVYHIFRRGEKQLTEYPQRMAIVASYLVYGILESRAFSFGNSYSVMFLLVAFDSSKFPIRRPGKPAEKPAAASPAPEPERRPEPAGPPGLRPRFARTPGGSVANSARVR